MCEFLVVRIHENQMSLNTETTSSFKVFEQILQMIDFNMIFPLSCKTTLTFQMNTYAT